MKRLVVELTFDTPLRAFDHVSAGDILAALRRGYPLLREDELTVVDLRAKRTTFEGALTTIVGAFADTPAGHRAVTLLTGALALMDAASGSSRRGMLTTEDEYLNGCRRAFRRLRAAGLPGGLN